MDLFKSGVIILLFIAVVVAWPVVLVVFVLIHMGISAYTGKSVKSPKNGEPRGDI